MYQDFYQWKEPSVLEKLKSDIVGLLVEGNGHQRQVISSETEWNIYLRLYSATKSRRAIIECNTILTSPIALDNVSDQDLADAFCQCLDHMGIPYTIKTSTFMSHNEIDVRRFEIKTKRIGLPNFDEIESLRELIIPMKELP